MSGPVAAWYEDPSSSQHQRWWDGERWTEHTRLLTPEPVLAAPGTGPMPPPPPAPQPLQASYAAPGIGNGAWSAQPAASAGGASGDGGTLAIASLVCGVVWLFWLGSVAAIVTGIMALRRKVTGGHQAMAIIGIVLGGLSFLGAPVIAAVAIPVLLDQRETAATATVQSEVRNAAIEMETAYTHAGRYPAGNGTPIESAIPGYSPRDRDVAVTVLSSDDTGYCLESTHRSGAVAWYDSRGGGVIGFPCG